jgi:DNA-binding response OmpR family regulator
MTSAKRQGCVLMWPSPGDSAARYAIHAAAHEHRRRILVISDCEASRQAIVEQLRHADYDVRSVASDSASMVGVPDFTPELVVIDGQQSETARLQANHRVRAIFSVPILVLGSGNQQADRLIDRDDYLNLPFQESELLRRIRFLLGEDATAVGTPARDMDVEVPPLEGDLRYDDLVIRPRLHMVELDGIPIELTATEFYLLYFLASHPRQVFTRQQLLDRVWHYEYFGDARTVTVHMSRLRKKVEPDPANPRHLRTVRRVGYKFVP